jgi:hypothetical protein
VRVGLVIVTALVLAALGSWLGFRAVDGERYRALLLGQLTRVTGNPVVASGGMEFRLLPRPSLSIEGVRTEDGAFTARRLEARLDPLSLLGDVPRVTRLVISDARADLRGLDPEGFGGAVPDLMVRNLDLRWRDAAGEERAVSLRSGSLDHVGSGSGVALQLVLSSPRGDVSVSANLGGLSPAGSAATVNASLPGNIRLRLTGRLGPSGAGAGAVLSGQVDLTGQDAAILLGPAYAKQALRAEAQAELGLDRIILNDLRFSAGDIGGAGAASYTSGKPSRFDMALQINRLDLGLLASVLPGLTELPLPSGMSGDIDIGVAAASWRDGVIQQAKLEVDLSEGAIGLRRASALLPGGSDILLSGAIVRVAGQPRFDGRVEAGADNLHALLEWLGADLAGVPGDRLRRGQLQSRISYADGVLGISDLDLRLDSSRATGAAAIALRARPSFSADIEVDRLNLNNFDFGALSGQPDAPFAILSRFDTDFRMRVGALAIIGDVAERASVDLRLYGGKMEVAALSAVDMAGASVDASGVLTVAPSGAAVLDARVAVQGGSLARSVQRLGDGTAIDLPDLPFAFSAQIASDPRRVSAHDLSVTVGEARAQGDVDIRDSGTPPLRLSGRLSANQAMSDLLPQLVEAAGEKKLPGQPTGHVEIVDDAAQPLFLVESGGGVLGVVGR